MKRCSTCKQMKPESEFRKAKRNPDGLKYQCKACMLKYEKSRDPDKKHDYAKKYRENNKDVERARLQKWKTENREEYTAYKKAMRTKRRSYSFDEYDKGITVRALFDRNGGICELCGKPCDFSDRIYENGVFIAGKSYPSIDHIIPVSKGGSHTWDNVQLAHRSCNSVKHNKVS